MPRPTFKGLSLLGGLLLLAACSSAEPPPPKPLRPATKTQAIDPFSEEFRRQAWICVLCPGSPPGHGPEGCASSQTGLLLRFDARSVKNPNPLLLVSAKELASGAYEVAQAQPVPDALVGRTFEVTEFRDKKSYPVFVSIQKDWVSFCSVSDLR